MDTKWGNLMRLARRAVNLTQEDFASDFGKSRSLISQWESGLKPIPPHMQRMVVDILSGYYKSRPEIKNVEQIANAHIGISSVHFQGHRGLFGSELFLNSWNEKFCVDFRNTSILPYLPSDCLVVRLAEEYTFKILEGKSEFAQITVFDRSALIPDYFTQREITPISVGVGTVLLVREKLVHMSETVSKELWATAITRDGTEEVLF